MVASDLNPNHFNSMLDLFKDNNPGFLDHVPEALLDEHNRPANGFETPIEIKNEAKNEPREIDGCWYYKDLKGIIQGPFQSFDMEVWWFEGYVTANTLVALSKGPREGTPRNELFRTVYSYFNEGNSVFLKKIPKDLLPQLVSSKVPENKYDSDPDDDDFPHVPNLNHRSTTTTTSSYNSPSIVIFDPATMNSHSNSPATSSSPSASPPLPTTTTPPPKNGKKPKPSSSKKTTTPRYPKPNIDERIPERLRSSQPPPKSKKSSPFQLNLQTEKKERKTCGWTSSSYWRCKALNGKINTYFIGYKFILEYNCRRSSKHFCIQCKSRNLLVTK